MSVKPVAGNVDRCGELESLAFSILKAFSIKTSFNINQYEF